MDWNDSLSDLIVNIYRKSSELPLEEFRLFIFEQTKNIINFDSGIWITRSQLKRPLKELDTFLYRQPEAMMQNYERVLNKCGITDPLFEQSFLEHGKAYTADAQDFVYNNNLNPLYAEHCKPYCLEYALSTLFSANKRGVDHIISLYRADRSQPFNDRERQLIEWLTPHLVESFRLNLLHHFRRSSTGSGFSGICDRFGVIVEAEEGFLRELGLSDKDDFGVTRIKLNFEQLPSDGMVSINDSTGIKVSHSSGLFYLELQQARVSPELTTRQQQLVDELVKGLPDKVIANNLNISVKTVRNQLCAVYKKLNVNGRSATIAHQLSIAS